MDKPTTLAFSDEATFRFLRGANLIPIFIILAVYTLVLVTGDLILADLALTDAMMIAAGFGWAGLSYLIALGHRLWEKYQIKRMFAGEIWECWQFSSSEWQAKVEAVCNLINYNEEGQNPYIGVLYTSIIGLVIAAIMIGVAFFVMDDPETKTAMRIAAGAVFLFMVGVGLFQPLVDRKKADRYRRKALRVEDPHVWFGPDGIYHETLGHTSLKELHKVTDQTKSRKRIQFTLVISSADSDDVVKVPTPVPAGCEERAGNLVRRYRTERLIT